MDISSNFDGGALRFSVTGEGVSIDPETGILSIATDALRDGVSVTVTAVNSGGAVAQTFRLDVALPEIALPVAPEMVSGPSLPETAVIGTTIPVEAGTWSGTPAPDLTYQWLLDGVEITDAVEASYLPLATQDGSILACRVTATNAAGTAGAVSSAANVRHAIPQAAGGLADLLLDAGSGPVTVAAGAEFSGENLVFSVTGAGAAIDSATGLVTISTDDLQNNEPIIVTAGNSGGSATSTFRVTVRPVAPSLRAAPSLDGTGVIGETVIVEPGLWDGVPAPELSFRWICGGDEIAGATDAVYMPGPAEDGKELVCDVTATNAGGSETARTPGLALVLPAPVVTGTLADVSAEQGAPALEVDAAAVFAGDNLVFAVAGAGAEIDAATGVVAIPTDTPVGGATITVTASNSGGTVEASFLVTIEAAEAEVPEDSPAPLADDQWRILRSDPSPEVAVDSFRPVVAFDADIAIEAAQWTSSGEIPPRPEHWETLAPAGTPGEFVTEMLNQGTGDWHVFTEAQAFRRDAGIRLRYRVAADGAWSEASTAKSVPLPEVAAPLPVPPLMLAGPVLAGSAKVGTAMTVETGSWSGDPTPQIACQWLRDGVAIEGAVGTEYLATAEDDLAEIACRVTATNAGGSAEALTAALTVTHVAPVAKGDLLEEILDEGTGPQEIPTAQDFEGEALVFAVEGAAAEIDAATGIVSIPTDSPVDGATVTVTASNSGGAAASSFLVTIEAAEPEVPEGPPAPLADTQWEILRSEPSPEIAADSFRPVIAIAADLPVEAAQWTTSDQIPPLPEHWETLAPTKEANTFTTEMLNQGTGDWHVFTEAQKFRRSKGLRIRYRLAADGAWSEESTAKEIPLPTGTGDEIDPEPAPNGDPYPGQWARFFTSSVAAKKDPKTYRFGKSGFQLQFCHGGDRSPVNPNKAMMIMDVGLGWVTENAEEDWPVWRHTASVNAGTRLSVGVKFDPDREDRLIYAQGEGRAGTAGGQQGLYISDDLGASYRPVLKLNHIRSGTSEGAIWRTFRHLIDYDPSDHNRWFFFNPTFSVWRSLDRGETWKEISTAPQAKNMGRCWYIKVDRSNGNLIWAATSTGLWKSTNGGVDWAKANANLPAGYVTSMDFNPENTSDFYVVVYGVGLYRTTNGGGSFTKVATSHTAVGQVAVSLANRNHIWLMSIHQLLDGSHPGRSSLHSTDAGKTWTNITTTGDTYGWDRGWTDMFKINGKGDRVSIQNVILPSPRTATRAIATSMAGMWRTNNGSHWVLASDGYDNLAAGESNLNSWGFGPDTGADRVIACGQFDYRLFISRDNGDSFERGNVVNTKFKTNHVMASVSVNPENPDYLLMTSGYYNPNPLTVLVSKDGGRSTSQSFRPAFFTQTFGNDNDNQHFAQWHPKIGRYAFAQKGISSDWGTTWVRWESHENGNVFAGEGCGGNDPNSGVHAVSPSNGSVLWATSGNGSVILRTTDMGKSWTKVVANGGPGTFANHVLSVCPDPKDADVFYWWNNGLKKYTAGSGVTTSATELAGRRVQRIRVSYQNSNHIYLFARDNGQGMVYRSTTGAAGPFVDISGNLPRVISNRSLEIDPATGIIFVIGTIGTRMFPPPGGHPRYNELARRFGL